MSQKTNKENIISLSQSNNNKITENIISQNNHININILRKLISSFSYKKINENVNISVIIILFGI